MCLGLCQIVGTTPHTIAGSHDGIIGTEAQAFSQESGEYRIGSAVDPKGDAHLARDQPKDNKEEGSARGFVNVWMGTLRRSLSSWLRRSGTPLPCPTHAAVCPPACGRPE